MDSPNYHNIVKNPIDLEYEIAKCFGTKLITRFRLLIRLKYLLKHFSPDSNDISYCLSELKLIKYQENFRTYIKVTDFDSFDTDILQILEFLNPSLKHDTITNIIDESLIYFDVTEANETIRTYFFNLIEKLTILACQIEYGHEHNIHGNHDILDAIYYKHRPISDFLLKHIKSSEKILKFYCYV